MGVDEVFGRGKPRTQAQQVREELTESYDHLKLAAAHMAGGAAEKLTPRYDKARFLASSRMASTRGALSPISEQVREGIATARGEREPKRRWRLVVGLIAAGAAVGATGAVIARRRRAELEWKEFEPGGPIDEGAFGDLDTAREQAKARAAGTKHKVTAGAASVADSVSSQAGRLADSLHDRSTPPRSMNQSRSTTRDTEPPPDLVGM